MNSTFRIAGGRRTRRAGQGGGARRYSRHAPALLRFFARHRVALADHVRREFADRFATDRTARLHLQTLVAAGDLDVMRVREVGQPNVYVITNRGMRTAGEQGVEIPTGERRKISGTHLGHELLITECAVSVGECARERSDLHILWDERFGFHRSAAFRELIPDYGFLFRQHEGRMLCLVEVSRGEESPARLGAKLDKYAGWQASPEGQQFLVEVYRRRGARRPRPTFRLLFVVQNRRSGRDETRLRQLFGEAMKAPKLLRRRIWATTVAELAATEGMAARIWRRGSDLDEAEPTWASLAKARRHTFLGSQVRQMPRHSLFPEEGR